MRQSIAWELALRNIRNAEVRRTRTHSYQGPNPATSAMYLLMPNVNIVSSAVRPALPYRAHWVRRRW